MLQRPSRRPGVGVVAAFAAAVCVASLAPAVTQASSHREAPLIAGEPQLDNTDLYAFVSPDAPDTVTMIANWMPFEEPNGGPNFYPFATDAAYDINIDNDGDAQRRRHLPVDVHRHLPEPEHVPLQHRRGRPRSTTRT